MLHHSLSAYNIVALYYISFIGVFTVQKVDWLISTFSNTNCLFSLIWLSQFWLYLLATMFWHLHRPKVRQTVHLGRCCMRKNICRNVSVLLHM